jgi:hypothetical protein
MATDMFPIIVQLVVNHVEVKVIISNLSSPFFYVDMSKKKKGANIEIYLIIQLNIIWTCHENYRYSMSKKKKL